jgi:putative ABC transport system permease protein
MLQDLRYAGCLLAKSPSFTLVALLALALGIGGNTAMFSMIYGVVLKPLEYRDPDRLFSVMFSFPSRPGMVSFTPVRLEEMRAAHSIAELGSYLIGAQNFGFSGGAFSGGAEPEALKGYRVSANFLDILGVRPVLGHGFLPDEDYPGSRPVVLNRYTRPNEDFVLVSGVIKPRCGAPLPPASGPDRR